jgi:hypothetical protein
MTVKRIVLALCFLVCAQLGWGQNVTWSSTYADAGTLTATSNLAAITAPGSNKLAQRERVSGASQCWRKGAAERRRFL